MQKIIFCSRCNDVFMYSSTDIYLTRLVIVVDEFRNIETKNIVVCRDCDFREKWIHKEVKVKEDNPYEHLNQYRLLVVDIENNKVDFRITVQVGDTDSFEWFKEEELEICKEN